MAKRVRGKLGTLTAAMQTLPPIGRSREHRTAIVRKVSRRRCARPLSQLTAEIENELTLAA